MYGLLLLTIKISNFRVLAVGGVRSRIRRSRMGGEDYFVSFFPEQTMVSGPSDQCPQGAEQSVELCLCS
jgi:hypothetical protein